MKTPIEQFSTWEKCKQAFKEADNGSPSWVWDELDKITFEPMTEIPEFRIEDIGASTQKEREELVQKMDIEGYRCATIVELVYFSTIKELCTHILYYTLKKYNLDGYPQVPCIGWGGWGRLLGAYDVGDVWNLHYRFLFVSKSLELNPSSSLDTKTLDAIKLLKEQGYIITKQF